MTLMLAIYSSKKGRSILKELLSHTQNTSCPLQQGWGLLARKYRELCIVTTCALCLLWIKTSCLQCCQSTPDPFVKYFSKHEELCFFNDSNKKKKPRTLPIITNWIGCSLPEISWAISKQNYPQKHICPIILSAITAAAMLQAGSFLSSSPQKVDNFYFLHEVHGSQCFTTCTLKKKNIRERKKETMFTICLYSRSVCFRAGGCIVCICIVCERVCSGDAAGKIMEDHGTVFSDKLSSGTLQLYCRKWYLRLQLICESQERQITDSSSGL